MKRLLAAAAALATGGALSAALLLHDRAAPAGRSVVVAAHDLAAGAAVTPDAVRPVRIGIDAGLAATALGPGGITPGMRATHSLAAGQLLQRSDVETAAESESRLVLLAVKDAPAVAPGDRVDLLAVTGQAEHVAVTPFLQSVEVRAAGPNGVVVAVAARQAPALVFAAATTRLVMVGGSGRRPAPEPVVHSFEQALAEVRG